MVEYGTSLSPIMRLGIDLGGTKIEIIALDDSGKELMRRRVPTPKGDYYETLQAIVQLVHDAEAELGQRGSLGIGTPGALSRATGRLKNSNSVVLNGQPILQDLESLLQRQVKISNDANCFALSEATDGAAKGAEVVFGVILGTGVGAGIVVNGHVLTGPNGIAGEWGHNPLPWPQAHELPGPHCYCGKKGCIETFLSGPGMAKLHQIENQESVRPEPAEGSLQSSGVPTGVLLAGAVEGTDSLTLNAKEIVAQAEQGDPACERTMQTYENRLARSLAHVINILDPDVIVLGGGMSNIERLYANVPRIWGDWVFSDRVDTRLLKNKYGDSSGVRGAAWL
ncbi:fructokinase [mine drainage metagenome]|uniref:Fructokinase n=1 Tax=mine drainage metagenome TaxID=410659 RepID=A0A1J5T3I6_9ZZZZ